MFIDMKWLHLVNTVISTLMQTIDTLNLLSYLNSSQPTDLCQTPPGRQVRDKAYDKYIYPLPYVFILFIHLGIDLLIQNHVDRSRILMIRNTICINNFIDMVRVSYKLLLYLVTSTSGFKFAHFGVCCAVLDRLRCQYLIFNS